MNTKATHFACSIKCSLYSFLFLFLLISGNSCKKNDLVPAYIHIDHINLTTLESEGTNSNKITDAWVYIDDNLIGIYELPATFPVLATGTHTVSIRAGIKLNGIAMSRSYYPFYQTDYITVDLQPEQIDTILPEVTYFPDKIHWNEDFEDGGITIIKFGESDTAFTKTTNPAEVFEGLGGAVVNLDTNYSNVLCASDELFAIPQNQSAVFLEMNYKTDTYLLIGMYGTLSSGNTEQLETVVLNPTTEWKKIYVNFTPTVNTTYNTSSFRVFFYASRDAGVANQKICLDNIKLLYNN